MNIILRLLLIGGFLAISSTAGAVDLANRLGIGYSNQFSPKSSGGDLPSITAQYYPNAKTGISLALGVDTLKNDSQFGVLFKLYRIVFTENNMNFYMGGGAGLVSQEQAGNSNSGFELSGYVGVEYFFTGLENLGFSMEAGVGVRSDSDGTRFRTIGDHPLRAGIIFYF